MLRLAHAIPNDLTSSELHLFAIGSEVFLYLYHEIRIRQAHLVTDRRTKHLCIGVALHCVRHLAYLSGNAPMTSWLKPLTTRRPAYATNITSRDWPGSK